MKNNFENQKWNIEKETDGQLWIDCNGELIAKICHQENSSGKLEIEQDEKDNARLISKSPEMLQLIIKLRNCLEILINITPSGGKRNSLTDENILALQLINECIGNDKNICKPIRVN